jgi:hypothetical protein
MHVRAPCLRPGQASWAAAGANDLLNTGYRLAGGLASRVGAVRDGTAPPFHVWTWDDGTNNSNINCGAKGCGVWGGAQPSSTAGQVAMCMSGAARVMDDINSATQSSLMEVEFRCPSGHRCVGASRLLCAAGQYSVGGTVVATCTACPGGTYGAVGALTSAACSGACTAGWYSLAGATACTICPQGTFGNSSGLASAACSGACTAGFVAGVWVEGGTFPLPVLGVRLSWPVVPGMKAQSVPPPHPHPPPLNSVRDVVHPVFVFSFSSNAPS